MFIGSLIREGNDIVKILCCTGYHFFSLMVHTMHIWSYASSCNTAVCFTRHIHVKSGKNEDSSKNSGMRYNLF